MIITAQYAEIHPVPPGSYRSDRDQSLAVITDCRDVRGRGPDIDLQSIFGETIGDPLSPLHNSDGIGDSGVQIKIIQLGRCR